MRTALVNSLTDADPFVRRHACEGLMQQPAVAIPVDKLIPLLSDPDRFIRFAARVAIEHAELRPHRARLLGLPNSRASVEGMLAVVRATRIDRETEKVLCLREIELLMSKPDREVERDLLRLIELTLLLRPDKGKDVPLVEMGGVELFSRFSTSTDSPANREIARLLAYFDMPSATVPILRHLASIPDHSAQIHDAYCLRAMKNGWTAKGKEQLWAWYEAASRWEGGYSFVGYLDYMVQDLVELLSPEERDRLLARGEAFPFPTRVLVRELSLERDTRYLPELVSLYRRVVAIAGGRRLR